MPAYGALKTCGACGSQTPPRVTREVWDHIDDVIVGDATCDTCAALYVFSRKPTAADAVGVREHQTKGRQTMKLFEVGKLGMYLDTLTHGTEKRRDEEVKICTLGLRIQPFTSSHAVAMADGVKPTLFSMNSGEPKPLIRRADFALGTPRQNLHVFAAPDIDVPSIVFYQVKIASPYARTEKGVNGFAFVFRALVGPLGRTELEYLQEWHLSQRFVSFEEAEPGMFEDATTEESEDDEVTETPARPAAMFDDPRDQAAPAKPGPRRTTRRKADSGAGDAGETRDAQRGA